MKITDLNPLGGIGANCLLLECGPFRIVIDAGMSPKEAGPNALPKFELLRGKPIDFILLTHCHLDHLGSIPVLMREHPEAILLLSAPSNLIARRMLHNSCNVMMRQKVELGIAEYPLFTRSEVERLTPRMFPLHFDHPRFFGASDGSRLALTLHRSGHIPGAAAVTLEYNHERILFSGDVLFTPQRILGGAQIPRDAVDTLVLETTRGATERHAGENRQTELTRLRETIVKTIAGGGSALVPTFALGRMQELLTLFADWKAAGQFPRAPIIASGLGLDLVNYFDEIARKTGEVSFSRSVLKELGVTRLSETLKPGRAPKTPAIYLLSSGMIVENTPSYAAAASLLGDERSAVCFVGYCDPSTTGGALLASDPDDSIPFDAIDFRGPRRAQIEKFDLSSHADRDELVDFAVACRPRTIVLTHGDQPARDWFQTTLSAALPNTRIIDPVPLVPFSC